MTSRSEIAARPVWPDHWKRLSWELGEYTDYAEDMNDFADQQAREIADLEAKVAELLWAGRAFYNAVLAISDAALRGKDEPPQETLDRLTDTAREFNAALAGTSDTGEAV